MAGRILSTQNYRQFHRHSAENRPLDLKKHRKLTESMQLYGFLRCFPIVVTRNDKDQLIVKDGQHRLAIAEELGLTVYWIEETTDFDVAIVNSTSKIWVLRDYAQKHAANGVVSYQTGLEFAREHELPLSAAFSLLSGVTHFSNCQNAFVQGTWKVKDRQWAEDVAGIYCPIVNLSPCMKNARFIEACMAVCRVESFSPNRLLESAERCRDKLVAYSTRDAYLDMMEVVYNFHRKQLVGLKALAVMAMRERSAAGKNPKARAASTNGVAVPA